MQLDDIPDADVNPKEHDLRALNDSIERFGFVDAGTIDERTGKLVAGHGRKAALLALRDAGSEPPEGITIKAGSWRWS